jgi:hypothetical protein
MHSYFNSYEMIPISQFSMRDNFLSTKKPIFRLWVLYSLQFIYPQKKYLILKDLLNYLHLHQYHILSVQCKASIQDLGSDFTIIFLDTKKRTLPVCNK